jgi:hypothetical protein
MSSSVARCLIACQVTSLYLRADDCRKLADDRRHAAYLDVIEEETTTVSQSITHTLRDVQKHANTIRELKELGHERTQRAKDAYQVTMRKIMVHFADEGERIRGCETLTNRLETYELFLRDLKDNLVGDTPSKDFKDMKRRIEKLLQIQEKSFEESLGLTRLSLGPDVPKFEKQKSWERKRPSRERPERPQRLNERRPSQHRAEQRLEYADRSAAERRRRERRNLYDSSDGWDHLVDSTSEGSEFGSPVGWEYEDDGHYGLPDVVEPPNSRRPAGRPTEGRYPAYKAFEKVPDASSMGYFQSKPTAPEPPRPAAYGGYDTPPSSGATPSTLSSDTNISDLEHWLPVVFKPGRPSTHFRTSGSDSGCFGEHDPAVQSELRDQYDRLITFPFNEAHLELSIYTRPHDRHTKLLVSQCSRSLILVSEERVLGVAPLLGGVS